MLSGPAELELSDEPLSDDPLSEDELSAEEPALDSPEDWLESADPELPADSELIIESELLGPTENSELSDERSSRLEAELSKLALDSGDRLSELEGCIAGSKLELPENSLDSNVSALDCALVAGLDAKLADAPGSSGGKSSGGAVPASPLASGTSGGSGGRSPPPPGSPAPSVVGGKSPGGA
jgi:hypothetical protein